MSSFPATTPKMNKSQMDMSRKITRAAVERTYISFL